MYLETKQDRSVYYWLKDKFSASPFVNIVDGFPVSELVLPTISVEADTIDTAPYELGNPSRLRTRVWYFDIHAVNKNQRNEFSYRLLEELEASIPVYNYDEGYPPDVSPTQIGAMIPDDISLKFHQVIPELDLLYYRATVVYTAIYSYI